MKKAIVSLLVVALAISSVYFFKRGKNKDELESTLKTQQEIRSRNEIVKKEPQISATPAKAYTMEEVAAHGADPDSEECWTVIHDKVYDILDFASNSHPGGELIFQACGVDATELFETRPMGSKTPHSENARKILEKYYIGDLKK